MPPSSFPVPRVTVDLASAAVCLVLFMTALAARPAPAQAEDLISGIGLTELTVYDQRPAPDGLMSGSPHVHAVTDEGYYVVSGKGRVELHDLKDGFRSVDLLPGRYVQFPPGVVHRLVNADRLVLLVVMGNAGLAERGDARIYFGKKVDDDPADSPGSRGWPRPKASKAPSTGEMRPSAPTRGSSSYGRRTGPPISRSSSGSSAST